MRYTKPPLTLEQQADLLIFRGLLAEKSELIDKLQAVNYYRLSGYWFPFIDLDDSFKKETTLEAIWQRYTFDRQLRLLVLDAIERVEISVRTQIVYRHCHKYGPFGYSDKNKLPKINQPDYQRRPLKNLTFI